MTSQRRWGRVHDTREEATQFYWHGREDYDGSDSETEKHSSCKKGRAGEKGKDFNVNAMIHTLDNWLEREREYIIF